MKNNILITSAGKRVVLTKYFKETLAMYFAKAKVFTTDMNPQMAPAGYVSDGCFKVPRVTSEDYIEILLTLCIENNIGLIVPTIDTELLILSANKEIFAEQGIVLSISDYDFIQVCRDKRKTNVLFEKLNIRIPLPVDKHNPIFPLFAKPYDGSLSKDLYVVKSKEELTSDIMNHPKLIFMEYIDKDEYKEFTVDMYFGKDNKVKSIVPRERIEIRAGEISKGLAIKNYLLDYLKDRMDYILGVVGCVCVQLFYRKSDNDVVAIEINPRFGGGYPLSYAAGANYPKFLIQEYLLGESIEYSDNWKDNTLMLRYDDAVFL
ncbi:ATP-grasp domain-containing protein [Bacteroides bouchesdurhonensis]|uniref:ATP-grasp domain-containing protein n=1 Tax=Bacteroides bouchesdurhonensis TaxID=1841855 RepID=UPI0011DD22F9|nr:ATP-grasp domain-containing protein [Bacteroides bouchesdurhonensis]